jgi:hypothetical protein
MTTATTWLMPKEKLDAERREFIKHYFEDGEVFNTPYGAGYWLWPVTHQKQSGWLAFEYDENTFDQHDKKQHAAAIRAWRNGETLPTNYFRLSAKVAGQVFDNILRMWGEAGIDEIDLPRVDEALQGTILGEQRYG